MESDERISTGVKGFDKLVEGGLIPGKVYLIVGPPGSGKTTFAMQFLLEGARNGERVAYVSLVHDPREAAKDMARFDPSIWVYVNSGNLILYDFGKVLWKSAGKPPTWGGVLSEIKTLAQTSKISRLVIDPLSAIEFRGDNPAEKRAELSSFTRSVENLGVTTFFVSELTELDRYTEEHYISHGVIMLHYFLDEEKADMVRAIQVLKMRRTKHKTGLFLMRFTDRGLEVLDKPPL